MFIKFKSSVWICIINIEINQLHMLYLPILGHLQKHSEIEVGFFRARNDS